MLCYRGRGPKPQKPSPLRLLSPTSPPITATPNDHGGHPHVPGPHNPHPSTGRHAGIPPLPPTGGHHRHSSRARLPLRLSPDTFNRLHGTQNRSDSGSHMLDARNCLSGAWYDAPVNPRGPDGPFGSQIPYGPLGIQRQSTPPRAAGQDLLIHPYARAKMRNQARRLSTIEENPTLEDPIPGPETGDASPKSSPATSSTHGGSSRSPSSPPTSNASDRYSLPSSTGATGTPSIPSAPPTPPPHQPSSPTNDDDNNDVFLRLLLATAFLSHLHDLNALRRLLPHPTPYSEPDWDRIIAVWRGMLFSEEVSEGRLRWMVEVLGDEVRDVRGVVREMVGGWVWE